MSCTILPKAGNAENLMEDTWKCVVDNKTVEQEWKINETFKNSVNGLKSIIKCVIKRLVYLSWDRITPHSVNTDPNQMGFTFIGDV